MTILEAVIQGVIQGLTEFLPVSSSGHLALYQYFTGRSGETGALFALVLHLGTLLAVFVAFWPTIAELIGALWRTVCCLFGKRYRRRFPDEQQRLLLLLAVSLLPLFLTLALKDPLRAAAQDNNIIVEGVCFLLTGALLLFADSTVGGRAKAPQMTYRAALAVGLMQAAAPLPGLSRSGSTLSTGLLLGLEKQFAITFSFLMGIPAVCAALLLDAGEILHGGMDLPFAVIAAGLAASAVFGLLAIRMVRWLVASNKLRWFGYYTVALGVLTLGIGIFEMIAGHPIQQAVMALLQ